jgi:HTH-type transcriptional regulator / antitoxin HipB
MHKIESMDDLSPLIRQIRKKAGLSQEELASYSGLSRTAIQAVESAKETVQIDTLFKIMTVLNIKLFVNHDLLEKDDEI